MRLYHSTAFDFSHPVKSYWEASAPPLGRDAPRLDANITAEFAIIGAGYTGLNAALRLVRRHGAKVVVLEAGQPGWGASGRNGGFCCDGSSKLSPAAMDRRFGSEATRIFYRAQRAAIDHVAELLETETIDAQRSGSGSLLLAHKPNRVRQLLQERDELADQGEAALFLDRDELAQRGFAGPQFHAGLLTSEGFGLHPLKYCRGLARAAIDAGVAIYGASPVTAWRQQAGQHVLHTRHGNVQARKVLLATNGYSDEALPAWIKGRLLPALSRIIVTRPMSDTELAAQGWTSHVMAADTRNLLHYFRLLPDKRMMFGGRGGLDASPAGLARSSKTLRATFDAFFPAWRKVETEFSWSGFVCLASGLTPYLGPIETMDDAWAALAYHGNGVAMASYSGAMAADVMAGAAGYEECVPAVMRAPLKRFPLSIARLTALRAAYAAFTVKDEWL